MEIWKRVKEKLTHVFGGLVQLRLLIAEDFFVGGVAVARGEVPAKAVAEMRRRGVLNT